MPAISSHEEIGTSGISTFEKDIVVRVRGDLEAAERLEEMATIPDQLKELLPQTFSNREFRPGEDPGILVDNCLGDIQTRRPGDRDQEGCSLKAVGFQRRRDQDIGVDHEAEWKHQRFALAARMTRSIWREVSPLVFCRWASIPIALRTSGSGAASFT